MPKAVYIHIPFCTNKCYYCDFNSYVTQDQKLIWDYLYALEKEMEITVQNRSGEPIESIFVGGGTPTFLSTEQMAYFLSAVQRHFFNQALDLEFTMEANPGTTDPEKLRIMRKGGVNRISYGVQSFDDELLKRIGRIHDSNQVLASIQHAKENGFTNISIDLMIGLPGQTQSILEQTLDQAFALNLQHFSAYSLKVEENTLFHILYERNQLILPEEDEEIAMYQMVMERMKANGYEHYEISNFAKPGFQSRHNKTYWKNEEYYGIGAGAHGYTGRKRHVNAGPVQQYIQLVQEKGLPRVEEFAVSKEEAMEEFMIMGLRMMEGVSSQDFYQRYQLRLDEVFGTEINELVKLGLLERDEERIRLSEKGILLGNEVFARFIR